MDHPISPILCFSDSVPSHGSCLDDIPTNHSIYIRPNHARFINGVNMLKLLCIHFMPYNGTVLKKTDSSFWKYQEECQLFFTEYQSLKKEIFQLYPCLQKTQVSEMSEKYENICRGFKQDDIEEFDRLLYLLKKYAEARIAYDGDRYEANRYRTQYISYVTRNETYIGMIYKEFLICVNQVFDDITSSHGSENNAKFILKTMGMNVREIDDCVKILKSLFKRLRKITDNIWSKELFIKVMDKFWMKHGEIFVKLFIKPIKYVHKTRATLFHKYFEKTVIHHEVVKYIILDIYDKCCVIRRLVTMQNYSSIMITKKLRKLSSFEPKDNQKGTKKKGHSDIINSSPRKSAKRTKGLSYAEIVIKSRH